MVKVGIVGTSWWADAMYLPALRDHPQAKVVAICGRNGAKARQVAEQWNIPQVFTDYNAMIESGAIDALAARKDITLHAHSALLQGLLAGTSGARWSMASSFDPDHLRALLWTLTRDLGRDCPADLCIAYVRAQPWINGVIVGAKGSSQFALNLARFKRR